MKRYFETDKWQPIIENVTDILRIATCIIDPEGNPIIIPSQNRYGWRFDPHFFNVESNYAQITDERFELIDNFHLHYYAVPLKSLNNSIMGYVILGPMILNKRLATDEYQEISKQSGDNIEDIREKMEDIRVISQLNLEHILNMCTAAIKLSQNQLTSMEQDSSEDKRAKNIFQSMLNLSLAIADAESGSVMLFNSQTKELSVCVAKGLNGQYLNNKIQLHDGVSGVAFQENKTLIIEGKPDSRMRNLLKRQEIKQSIVMPFKAPNLKTSGVLNINIMKPVKGGKERLEDINGVIERITANILQVI